jgi:hypothetical protein
VVSYGVFGEEEEEFEDQHEEGSERNYLHNSQNVVLQSQEDCENQPFGAQLFLPRFLELA